MNLNSSMQKIVRWLTALVFFLLQFGSFLDKDYLWAGICMIYALFLTINEKTISKKFKKNYWIIYFVSLIITLILLSITFK